MAGSAESVQGKIFIGLILNVLLLGINITQTYLYYIHSKKDRLWIKIWVVVMFVADFIQPLSCFLYLYQTLVVHFGDEAQLLTGNAMFDLAMTMTGITSTLYQLFFAWRIRILTNNWYYVTCVIAAAVAGGVFTVIVAYEGGLTSQFAEFRHFKVVQIVLFTIEIVADTMITGIMVCFLHMHKTGFRPTDKMVDRIIRVTMQTGLMAVIFVALDMLFYLNSPGGTHFLLNLVLSKLYTSSFLSSLNSRQGWGYDADASESNEDLSTNVRTGLRFASNSGSSTVDQTSVLVTTPIDSNGIELGLQKRQVSIMQ